MAMKADRIRAQVTVTASPKAFAIIVAILDSIWSHSERVRLIKQLQSWYGVS
jgi:hypothetical protein